MARSSWAATFAVAMVLALPACSDDTSDTPASPTPSPTQSMSATMEVETVTTATSSLGTILVDEDGMTLYLFTKDTQGSGASTCAGDCLTAWPAVEAPAQAGSGVDAAKLGSITRDDGSKQATYNGWPLYYYQDDTAPGLATGQGVGGVWWVLDPAGDAIR